ncbi:hypothetical protein TNCV_1233171 [Trichonephila clavipes]|nr:hypothetical protein TNCV_1233171 [Trichonephila clavipes]
MSIYFCCYTWNIPLHRSIAPILLIFSHAISVAKGTNITILPCFLGKYRISIVLYTQPIGYLISKPEERVVKSMPTVEALIFPFTRQEQRNLRLANENSNGILNNCQSKTNYRAEGLIRLAKSWRSKLCQRLRAYSHHTATRQLLVTDHGQVMRRTTEPSLHAT